MNRYIQSAFLAFGLATVGCGGSPEPQTFDACTAPPQITAANPNYVWTPNAITLKSQRLADGIFAVYDSNAASYSAAGIPLATSGGFIIGENGVALVESMINRQLFCQMVSLVRAETDKPVTHVINTSSHGDHSFGNAFLPAGVHIVQHRRTAEYIAEHFQEDIEFMKMNFGADQGLDELHPVAADILVDDNTPYRLDLGGKEVEARYYGFAQTGGDLFVHVPSAKVVWTGNPLVAAKPAVPWLLAGHGKDVHTTMEKVKAALPADAIIVPGHDHPTGASGLDFAISYLDTLVREVGTSVNQGMTVEQTVAAVTMAPFQGYALWGWIHKMVNVPMTYADLKN